MVTELLNRRVAQTTARIAGEVEKGRSRGWRFLMNYVINLDGKARTTQIFKRQGCTNLGAAKTAGALGVAGRWGAGCDEPWRGLLQFTPIRRVHNGAFK